MILCMSGGAIFNLIYGTSEIAEAKLTVGDPTGLVGSTSLVNLVGVLAQAEADEMSSDKVDIDVQVDSATQSVGIEVSAHDAEDSVALANLLAENTRDAARDAFGVQADDFLRRVEDAEDQAAKDEAINVISGPTAIDRAAALRSCVFEISYAPPAEAGLLAGVWKNGVLGLLVGFLFAGCTLSAMDSVRRPIKTMADVAKETDAPILSVGSSQSAFEHFLVNLGFVVDGRENATVCILPMSKKSAPFAGELEQKAVEAHTFDAQALLGKDAKGACPLDSMTLLSCPSIAVDATSAQIAASADATVLVACRWDDSRNVLASTLSGLRLAKANVVGIALI